MGIQDTIRLLTEFPPKGAPHNFGLKELQFLAQMLCQPACRQSWEQWFQAGLPMYAGLTLACTFDFLCGKGPEQDVERELYTAFLDEADLLQRRLALHEVAELFRTSGSFSTKAP